jgi:uncharacterized membrane protein
VNLKQRCKWVTRLALVSIGTLAGIAFWAQRTTRTHAQNQTPNHVRVSVLSDWSHKHMVYSRPSSIGQALGLQSEPRYLNQLARRNAVVPQGTKEH